MNQEDHFQPFSGQIALGLLRFQCGRWHAPALHLHASRRHLKRSPFGNPQIAQCKQHDALRRVLGQPVVTHAGASEWAFNETERGVSIGTHAELYRLRHAPQAGLKRALIQRIALARTRGRVLAVTSVMAHQGAQLGGRNTCVPTQELRPAHASELVRLKGAD